MSCEMLANPSGSGTPLGDKSVTPKHTQRDDRHSCSTSLAPDHSLGITGADNMNVEEDLGNLQPKTRKKAVILVLLEEMERDIGE